MFGKEPVSAWTHGLAAVLSVVGLVWLITLTLGDPLSLVAVLVYGICMTLMFTSSAMLHYFAGTPGLHRLLNKLDHIAIHLMIAGSYTGFCVFALEGAWRWGMIAAVWAVSLVGIVSKVLVFQPNSPLSTGLYIATGWLAIVAGPQLMASVPPDALRLIIAGGLIFTLGALVYTFDDPKVRPLFGPHEAWHLFVMAGAAAHFAAIVSLI
jgi:hemolysin III